MVPKRLRGLETVALPGICPRAYVAASHRARLLGLALLDELPPGTGLLIPRCRSVHTFGMRFALDVWFLDERHRPIGLRAAVEPGRIVSCREAAAVLELRARSPSTQSGPAHRRPAGRTRS